MSVALRGAMSLDDFLAWERAQERPYEFDGFEAIAMNGGTIVHALIGMNIGAALDARLEPPFRYVPVGVKVVVAGRVRYPDGVVTDAALDMMADIVPSPVVVFEVLSPSTSRTDRIAKTEEYRQTASIQHYVILEQGSLAATVFTRNGEDWSGRVVAGDAAVSLPSLGLDVPLAAFYARVTFPDVNEAGA